MELKLMAKQNNPVARARGRKPAPVKKPFPVGFVVGCTALALFLGGILTYAALNQGLGDKTSLTYANHAISDMTINNNVGHTHKEGVIPYPNSGSIPPLGGDHNPVPESCQVYTSPIANEHAVHSLEHGAVWVTYDPSLPAADVTKLKDLVTGDPYRMLSPYPGLKSPISLQAWGHQIFAKKASDGRIKRFLDLFTNGPQAREAGAACTGVTTTGPINATPAPTPTPSPKATAKPKPSPTKK